MEIRGTSEKFAKVLRCVETDADTNAATRGQRQQGLPSLVLAERPVDAGDLRAAVGKKLGDNRVRLARLMRSA
jgi:hypothetical protein